MKYKTKTEANIHAKIDELHNRQWLIRFFYEESVKRGDTLNAERAGLDLEGLDLQLQGLYDRLADWRLRHTEETWRLAY